MVNEEVRQFLLDIEPQLVLFDSPSFDNSIIGVSTDGLHVIYDYEKMIEEYALEEHISIEESIDNINGDTIRSLDYNKSTYSPIIMDAGPQIEFIKQPSENNTIKNNE